MPTISGVPTYGTAPINPNSTTASHPSAVTPQTASSTTESHRDVDQTVPARETATPTSTTYPQARPAAAAAPAPTGAATPPSFTPTRTTALPLQSTPTITEDNTSPLAPQPGARPSPLSSRPVPSPYTEPKLSPLPPPPKVGEVPKHPSYYTRTPQGSSSSTDIGSVDSRPFIRSSNGHGDISYPSQPVPNSTSTPYTSMYQSPNGTQLPQYVGHGRGQEEDEEGGIGQGVLQTAKSWVQTAGSKLAEAEAEVWRRVG